MTGGKFFRGWGQALRHGFGPPYEREDQPKCEPTVLESAGELRQAARHLKKISERIAPAPAAPRGEEREDQLQEALRRLGEGMRGGS